MVRLYRVKMLPVTPVSLSHHVKNMSLIHEKCFGHKQLRVPAIVAVPWF